MPSGLAETRCGQPRSSTNAHARSTMQINNGLGWLLIHSWAASLSYATGSGVFFTLTRNVAPPRTMLARLASRTQRKSIPTSVWYGTGVIETSAPMMNWSRCSALASNCGPLGRSAATLYRARTRSGVVSCGFSDVIRRPGGTH